MAIKEPFQLITIEELKSTSIYDSTYEKTAAHLFTDHYINEAIYMTTNLCDKLSGYQLINRIENDSNFNYDGLKYGVAKHVLHLLREGVEYSRANTGFNMGAQSYSITNPQDPFYVVPEIVNELQKLGMLAKQIIGDTNEFKNQNEWVEENFNGKNRYVNWADANQTFVKHNNILSNDNSILFSYDNKEPYNPSLNIQANREWIINLYEDRIEELEARIKKLEEQNNV